MAITSKATITLEDKQLQEVRALVAAEEAASLSGFVQHAVNVALHDTAGWRDMLNEAIEQTGGPLTKMERDWADAMLSTPSDPADWNGPGSARRTGRDRYRAFVGTNRNG